MGIPTSLATHRNSLSTRSRLVTPLPPHRQALQLARRCSKPTRALSIALALFLVYYISHSTTESLTRAAQASKEAAARAEQLAAAAGPTPSSKSLRFAPTQIKRSAARIHYRRGAVQDILVPPIRPRDGEPDMEALWTPGEVGKVDIPPGLVLSYVAEQGKQGSIEWGKGDACEKKSCHGMQKAKVKMDLLLALRQLKDADPGKEIIADFPSLFDWPSNAVTLVTQFTVGRLPRFERTLREWDGPVSFTIYLTDAIDIVKLEKYLVSSPTILERWQTFALTIVKPDYSVSQEALTLRLRYPINKLRNLALVLAPTHYVLNVDVDFVPSPNMHHLLQSRGVPLIRHGLAGTSSSPTLRRTAIAISAFALSPSYTGEYPSTPSSLAAALYASPPLATLTDPNAGHGPSLPSLLFHLPFLSSPPRPPLPPTQATWSYSITYEPQWEPYYLLHRASHPLYDERFTDQGGDKQSHALVLNALGYEFRMLRDVWFMHPPKGVKVVVASDSEESEEEEDGDEWPSARLIDPEQEERGDDKDHDPSHFNSVAQRDQRRFRYFQDWLPEVQEVWGANVRWPRGAGAREVARGRNFGRGRAGTVFGI